MFFVTTHSPFIVSEMNTAEQKAYLIENGATIGKNDIDNGENGFETPSEVLTLASNLLGIEEKDIGYPENFCIVEEYSLQILLDKLKEKGIIKNWGFISSSGWTKAANLTDTIDSYFTPVTTLLKCNPFYHDKYAVIIDKPNISDCEHECYRKLSTLGSKRFTVLNKNSIEEYYPIKLKSEYEKEIADKKQYNEKGKVKAKYALIFADTINNANAFSSAFCTELDHLLIEQL